MSTGGLSKARLERMSKVMRGYVERDGIAAVPGRYGWDCGFGTTFVADAREDMVAILLIQRLMTSPNATDINEDFLTLAYQAIDE